MKSGPKFFNFLKCMKTFKANHKVESFSSTCDDSMWEIKALRLQYDKNLT